MSNSDLMVFADDRQGNEVLRRPMDSWQILVVDDEEDVHRVTRLVLKDVRFLGKPIRIHGCHSRSEAEQFLSTHSDIAIVLLDVVMEEENAGLKLVRYIRETLGNSMVRIILRTGQPGQAPETEVVLQYDINDYKCKTELTSEKLFTTVIAALRSWRDMVTIDRSKKGLERIIQASAGIFEAQSLREFVSGVLMQLVSMLGLENDALYCHTSGFSATNENGELRVLAATGKYENGQRQDQGPAPIPDSVFGLIEQAVREKRTIAEKNYYIGFFRSKNGVENIIYLERMEDFDQWEKNLIDIFCSNVAIAFDNIYLNQEIEETQKEIIFTLGEIAEGRSPETQHHVQRVSEYSVWLGRKLGLPDKDLETLRLASAMHDIGKLAIPDAVLLKPDRLSTNERAEIQKHAPAGEEMLRFSKRSLIRVAARIAAQHHENWDGSGYPHGLAGEAIDLFARITAVADVFDALSSDRVYRKALPPDEVEAYMREQSGHQFDPAIVSLLLDNIAEVRRLGESLARLD